MSDWVKRLKDYDGPKGLQQDEDGIWCCTVGDNVQNEIGGMNGIQCYGRGVAKGAAIRLAFVRMEWKVSIMKRIRLASCHRIRSE